MRSHRLLRLAILVLVSLLCLCFRASLVSAADAVTNLPSLMPASIMTGHACPRVNSPSLTHERLSRRPAEDLAALRLQWGLDKPYITQYWKFISNVVQGELDQSFQSHNQIRTLLDPIRPGVLDEGYLEVFEGLEQQGALTHFRVLAEQLLLALDGTQYFSSKTIDCQNCLRCQTATGHIFYSHSAITPVIVCPGRSEVIQ
jgi:hypothetical protein